ncbi:MAG: TolC family protein [Alloprevotella sp.]
MRFKTFVWMSICWGAALTCAAQSITLEECKKLARENYPLIRQYALIEQTEEFTVKSIEKGNLPRLAVSAGATWQSKVTELPDAFKQMLSSAGISAKGMAKDQYRLQFDLQQNIYDGGKIRTAREVARKQSEVEKRENDVNLYALNARIHDLFFSMLLLEEQIRLKEEQQNLLKDNCRKVEAMCEKGVAMQSDVDALRAEELDALQQTADLKASRRTCETLLSLFIGRSLEGVALEKPKAPAAKGGEGRPELQWFEAKMRHNEELQKQLKVGLRPTLGFQASGFYGYPGYDMFESMFSRTWKTGILLGVQLKWNLTPFYSFKSDRRRLETQRSRIENAREVFLFQNRLEAAEDSTNAVRYKEMLATDDRIIELRESVRKAAERKLDLGVIDVNDLLREITRETAARIARSVHEVEMTKSLYDLQNDTNQ